MPIGRQGPLCNQNTLRNLLQTPPRRATRGSSRGAGTGRRLGRPPYRSLPRAGQLNKRTNLKLQRESAVSMDSIDGWQQFRWLALEGSRQWPGTSQSDYESMPGAGLESSSKIGALDGRTSDGPTTPNIGTGIRCMVDRTALYQRAPLDAPSTRHRGHKNKLTPGLVVAQLEADAVF